MKQVQLTKRQKLFIELLRLAVDGHRRSLSYSPSPADWAWLFSESRRQAVVGVMYAAVERLPAAQRPPREVLLPWYAVVERVKLRNEQLNAEATRVCLTLSREGLNNVLLKGQGGALYYPQPLLRQPGDIDLWILASRQRIMEHAQKGGENKVHTTWLHTVFNDSPLTEVEAHFMPSYRYNPFRHSVMNGIFDQMAAAQLAHKVALIDNAPSQVNTPTTAFNRLYLLAHIYRHFFGEGIGVRQLMDYYYCLRQGLTDAEARAMRRRLKRMGMTRFARATMYVIQQLFGLPVQYMPLMPDKREGTLLLSEVLLAGNFGQHDVRYAELSSQRRFSRFVAKSCRNINFLVHYPGEVLFDVPFRLCHYVWRWGRGYL